MFHASVARAYSNLENYDHNEQELLKIWYNIKNACSKCESHILYPVPEHSQGIKTELHREGYDVHDEEHNGLPFWRIEWTPIISNEHVELDTKHHKIGAIDAGRLSGYKYHKILLIMMNDIKIASIKGEFHLDVNCPEELNSPGYRCIQKKLQHLGYDVELIERLDMDNNKSVNIEYYWRIKW